MGCWSVKLYGNDDSSDLRDTFKDLKRIPEDAAALVARIAALNPEMRDPDDEAYCDLWLALMDQLHLHGLDDPETAARARSIIESGADIAMKRALEMSEKDLVKRQAELDMLLATWSKPHSKPRARNVLKAPEAHPFVVGQVIAYPTSRGRPGNPYHPTLESEHGWRHDGWGAFVVLAQGHVSEWFAWMAIARLNLHGPDLPVFAACKNAAIENHPGWGDILGKETKAMQRGAVYPSAHVRKLRLERLGVIPLDPGKVALAFPQAVEAPRGYLAEPLSVLQWWNKEIKRGNFELAAFAIPKPAVWLKDLV